MTRSGRTWGSFREHSSLVRLVPPPDVRGHRGPLVGPRSAPRVVTAVIRILLGLLIVACSWPVFKVAARIPEHDKAAHPVRYSLDEIQHGALLVAALALGLLGFAVAAL